MIKIKKATLVFLIILAALSVLAVLLVYTIG